MRLDLHIHTTCSDGSDGWEAILQKAQQLGLEYISLTDHNNVDVYFKIKEPQKYFSGKIIKGIEPECHYRGRMIELLGYGIDVEKMHALLNGLYYPTDKLFAIEFEQVYEGLAKNGIIFSGDVLKTWDKSEHHHPVCHLHADLVKYSENKKIITDDESWGNSVQFYRNHISKPQSPFYFDVSPYYPSAETIFKAIKQAGGLVFIPHIFLYGEDSVPFLEGLTKEFAIDGVECFYNSFTEQQTNFLLDFCRQSNLLVSAGSDYHGLSRPHVKLGVDNGRFKELITWLNRA